VRALDGERTGYDVQPDGSDRVVVDGQDEQRKKPTLRDLARDQLEDLGWATHIDAKVLEVNAPGGGADPWRNAIGYVRIGGDTDATQRGQILDQFKADPLTSVCLLTKRAAGVGLNLTEANHVVICEPSIDAHEELQAIMRVHRIGQGRPVHVTKLYTKGSVDERVLARRSKRGELNVSINAVAGGGGDEQDEEAAPSYKKAKGKGKARAAPAAAAAAGPAAGRTMGFEDLKMLMGVG